MEKAITPSNPKFWGAETEPLTREEETRMEHTYKAIEFAADAYVAMLRNEPISARFSDFFKECFYLRVLGDWDSCGARCESSANIPDDGTLKEFLDSEESMKKEEGKEEDEDDLTLPDDDDTISEEDPKVKRFIEIMTTVPENITIEMKREAFDLFPHVVSAIGAV